MGIDCANVCQIIHWGEPSDIESYVQECGRAGRNGNRPANAQMHCYFGKSEISGLIIMQTCKCTAQGKICVGELSLWNTLMAHMRVK
jgi:superfamily II DNA helicase RecQ